MAHARTIAAVADRIAFGSIYYAVSINALHTPRALAAARAELVLAAALVGRPAPIDGVTLDTSDPRRVSFDTRHSVFMGMGGKLLIHPQQIAPARQAYRPSSAGIARATKIVQNMDGGVRVIDGMMVDAPVVSWRTRSAQLVLGVPPSVAELPRFSPLPHFCESEHLSRSPETTVNDLVDQNHGVRLYPLSEIVHEECGCLKDDLLFLFCGNDTLGKFVVGEWHFDAPVV
jgi:hypothetical protein